MKSPPSTRQLPVPRCSMETATVETKVPAFGPAPSGSTSLEPPVIANAPVRKPPLTGIEIDAVGLEESKRKLKSWSRWFDAWSIVRARSV
ncbi:MAG: hypothetical protein M0D55_01635 [Elusimicrobiota bacterium]|nr:MAG: hypothetical protein M0D55_01635 [Elusimicrobiota bacterium]